MDDAEYAQRNEDFICNARIRRMRAEIAARAATPQKSECAQCGEPMPPERLAVEPGCTLCVQCKSLHERSLPCLSRD